MCVAITSQCVYARHFACVGVGCAHLSLRVEMSQCGVWQADAGTRSDRGPGSAGYNVQRLRKLMGSAATSALTMRLAFATTTSKVNQSLDSGADESEVATTNSDTSVNRAVGTVIQNRSQSSGHSSTSSIAGSTSKISVRCVHMRTHNCRTRPPTPSTRAFTHAQARTSISTLAPPPPHTHTHTRTHTHAHAHSTHTQDHLCRPNQHGPR